MKKAIVVCSMLIISLSYGQDVKPTPQINVTGEGQVKVIPDQATLIVSVDTKGNEAKEVKKGNDEKIEAVIKFIKKMNSTPLDYKTQRVALNPQYDYEKKKHSYHAVQTIEIILRDVSKYDELMEGLVNQGINRIDSVEFQSSKLVHYQSEARKLAMKDAKLKADDYVAVLGQKVGKAFAISDNSQACYPQALYATRNKMEMMQDSAPKETLAIGEINITANVSVSFLLE